MSSTCPTLLVISQVYVPDPTAVGQYMAEGAEAMAARGYRVVVLTSARGYENPQVRYPRRETRAGVEIVRLPLSSFGKRLLLLRLLGQGLFLLQVLLCGVFVRRLSGILVSTSPPMASFAALILSYVRSTPITYWLMDLNPDQAIALGKVASGNPLARAMKWLNQRIYKRAASVVILDRYMTDRVARQYDVRGKLIVSPPWPHEDVLVEVPRSTNPFRAENGVNDRIVVMYSGNHSPASPVTTLLQAALDLRDDQRFLFMFIGGGLGKREVDEAIARERPANIISLPYQSLDRIKYSLSAADLHVVTLGNKMPGMIHPCKIYGAMAIGRPVLLIGPGCSHAGDLIHRHHFGWQVDHGEVGRTVKLLDEFAKLPRCEVLGMGERARLAVREHYNKGQLCGAFCDAIELSMKVDSAYEIRSRERSDCVREAVSQESA